MYLVDGVPAIIYLGKARAAAGLSHNGTLMPRGHSYPCVFGIHLVPTESATPAADGRRSGGTVLARPLHYVHMAGLGREAPGPYYCHLSLCGLSLCFLLLLAVRRLPVFDHPRAVRGIAGLNCHLNLGGRSLCAGFGFLSQAENL